MIMSHTNLKGLLSGLFRMRFLISYNEVDPFSVLFWKYN